MTNLLPVVLVVVLALVGGCSASGLSAAKTEIDVTVEVDPTLNLDSVTVTATAPLKMPLPKSFSITPSTTSLHLAILVPNVTLGFEASVRADGSKGGVNVIAYAAWAEISPGQVIKVRLKLTAACAGYPACPVGLQCDDGVCAPIPVFPLGVDAGPGSEGGSDVVPAVEGGQETAPADGTGGQDTADVAPVPDVDGGLDAPSDGSPDLVPKVPKGESCGANADCEAGLVCSGDGVCCDSACTDTCKACRHDFTGQPDGTCAAVSVGTDPRNDCAMTQTDTCGTDGACDGKGSCRKYTGSQVCLVASCAGSLFTPSGVCNGSGQCIPGSAVDCKQFTCSVSTGCATTCSVDGNCLAGSYCQGTTCTVKKNDGQSCSAGHECIHGFCADGVCCSGACSGSCMACSLVSTGQPSGTCAPVQNMDDLDSCVGTCDGSGSCRPPGSILWARSASSVFLFGVVESSTGVIVTGNLSAPANLGGGLLAPVGATDTVIAQFAIADGVYLYSSQFGGGSPTGSGTVQGSIKTTLDFSGAPVVSGISLCDPDGTPACNQIDVGQGLVSPGGGSGADGFVGRYSVATGRASWAARLVGAGDDELTSTSNAPDGTVYVAGRFDQDTTLISGTNMMHFGGTGNSGTLLAQLNPITGAIGVTTTFADAAIEVPQSVAWTSSGIVLSGMYSGTATFGNTVLKSVDSDIWVAKVRPADGTPLWAVSLGGSGADKYPYMAVDSVGDIYLAGTVAGTATFGAYPIGGAGGIDIFVVKLRSADGSVAWATSFGSIGDEHIGDIAVGPSGQVVVSASLAGPLQAGAPWTGGVDAVLVSYTSSGAPLWTKMVGTSGTDFGFGVASGTNAFYWTMDLGADIGTSVEGVPIIGARAPTGLILKIVP